MAKPQGGDMRSAATEAKAARIWALFLRQQQAILDRPDSTALLPTIAVPTLVAVGDGDRLTPPADAHLMRDAIPDAGFHCFERCGHLPPLEKPDETSAVLRRWLDR